MTWTGQSFSVGQVLTAAQMNNLQADITALANGDSGAPAIQTAALQDSLITTAKINDTAVTAAKLPDAAAGSYMVGYSDRQSTETSTSYTKNHEFVAPVDGTYTTRLGIRRGTKSGTQYARVYVNGVATGTERSTTSSSFVWFNENVTVSAGDLVQLYTKVATLGETQAKFAVMASSAIFTKSSQLYTLESGFV